MTASTSRPSRPWGTLGAGAAALAACAGPILAVLWRGFLVGTKEG